MVLDRIPPAQRRLVILTAIAAVGAGLFVAVAVILAASNPPDRPEDYEAFRVGPAETLAASARERPLFFADPTGGTRGFALVVHEGNFVAAHVVPPGGTADCPVDWDVDAEQLEDCEGRAWTVPALARFPVELVEDDGIEFVVVDLRRRLPAPGR